MDLDDRYQMVSSVGQSNKTELSRHLKKYLCKGYISLCEFEPEGIQLAIFAELCVSLEQPPDYFFFLFL